MFFYPKRTDGVYAFQFNGTQQSAQSIGSALRVPTNLNLSSEGTAASLTVPGRLFPVKLGEYVVVNQDRGIVEVLDAWDFAGKYSKDGT
jgi:hypothetical protein